jgi:tetratricopeptide (TPR) repeat protein
MGRREEARTELLGMTSAMPAVLSQFISEPLYRDLWEIALPKPYQDALATVTLQDARADSAEYYRAKGRLYARRGDAVLERAYFDSTLRVLSRRRANGATGIFLFPDLGAAYAVVGRLAEARAYADSAKGAELMKQDAFRGWFAVVELARLYVKLDAPDEALAILERLKAAGRGAPSAWLRVDPAFAALLPLPRMQTLLSGS